MSNNSKSRFDHRSFILKGPTDSLLKKRNDYEVSKGVNRQTLIAYLFGDKRMV